MLRKIFRKMFRDRVKLTKHWYSDGRPYYYICYRKWYYLTWKRIPAAEFADRHEAERFASELLTLINSL